MHHRPPSPLTRLLGALLLGLFLASGLAEAYHQAAVVHVICPGDGQLAHAEGHGHDHAHGASVANSPGHEEDEGPALEADGAGSEEHHEHCGLADLGNSEGVDSAMEPREGAPRYRACPANVEAGAARHDSVSLLSLAPKQSPPRAV